MLLNVTKKNAMGIVASALCAFGQGACGQLTTELGEPGAAQFALSPGSCPVTTEIVSLEWEVERRYARGLFKKTISRADIDNHCAGRMPVLATMDLRPGSYQSVVSAKNPSSVIVNDLESASSFFDIFFRLETKVHATIKAATGTATANGSWTIDNASFDDAGASAVLVNGCCCPAMCKPESVLGCKRATANGICTGWTDPCGC